MNSIRPIAIHPNAQTQSDARAALPKKAAVCERVRVGRKALDDYAPLVGERLIREIQQVAAYLKGARLLHLNSTATAGGVAELLTSVVPLEADCGLDVEWWTIGKDDRFFNVTKKIHNGLQGQVITLSREEQSTYLRHSEICARGLLKYDLMLVHDPQPLALRDFITPDHRRWIWRCHIDTSRPSPAVWEFLRPMVERYDAAIFTLPEFVPANLSGPVISIIAPAIDPLSNKNRDMDAAECRRIMSQLGIDPDRPLIVQAGRFDPWKDPAGVIEAYRIMKPRVPALQLVLVGAMAEDDPEGWQIYRQIVHAPDRDPDIHIIKDLIGDRAHILNAFQRAADVAVVKSLREGFGLVVSEALWKGTPVVGGDTGGIRLQLKGGIGGFLVNSVPEAADRIEYLLDHPVEAHALGASGREYVREHFLTPRLLLDELKLLRSAANRDSHRAVDPS